MVSYWLKCSPITAVFMFLSAFFALGVAGCERKERVLDVQTPGADVEVDRNIDTGEVEVEVDDKD
jgi:hypothetical protein